MDNSDFDPNVFYCNGKWERIKGKVIVGVDESDSDFNVTGKTGGNKDLQRHNHPSLLIDGNRIWWGGTSSHNKLNLLPMNIPWNGGIDGSAIVTGEAGTGNSGNLQPYYTAYIWKLVSYS